MKTMILGYVYEHVYRLSNLVRFPRDFTGYHYVTNQNQFDISVCFDKQYKLTRISFCQQMFCN